MEVPETPEKHLAGYRNARALTGEQMDIVQRLTANLIGQIAEADLTVIAGLESVLLGRPEGDIFRKVGLAGHRPGRIQGSAGLCGGSAA